MSIFFIFVRKMRSKITKTYLGSTGSNNGIGTETATFHVNFPNHFVSSLNRKYITVMPPKLLWGGDQSQSINPSLPITYTTDSKIIDNMYILHCSFIHRDPYHDHAVINVNDPKRKYKKYEYKGCEDGFDITFTDYFPASDMPGWSIGNKYNGNLPDLTDDVTVLTTYFQNLFPDQAASLAQQCVDKYTEILNDIIEGITPDVPHYQDNQRFKKNSTTEYDTDPEDLDWYDIVSYIVKQNNLSIPLEMVRQNSDAKNNGDYREYTTQTHYIDYNINCYVTYSGYTKYKILKDSRPWYYYAEFMVEY